MASYDKIDGRGAFDGERRGVKRFSAVILEEASSTQDEARERFGEGEGGPVLVVAARQTRGRGRMGSRWETAPAAAAVSLAFRPGWPVRSWPLLTLTAGVAALRALRGAVAAGAAGLSLKWPNDLMRGEGKLGGILTEAGPGLAVAGWGVNLFWPDPPPGAGALLGEAPPSGLAASLGRRWAEEVLALTGGPARDWPHDEYRRACSTLGREIAWRPGGRGRAVDVNADGGLVVETEGGSAVLTAGEIREIRPAAEM